MVHFKTKNLLIIFLFCAFNLSAAPTAESIAKEITTITNAKALKRVPPKYPVEYAKQGAEGWVIVSYVVEPDGNTSNVLIERSSGRKRFEKEALRAIKDWKYNPALENGEPVQQCRNNVRLDFRMKKERAGVSRKFLSLYKKFVSALNEKDAERIEKLAPQMKSYKIFVANESFFKFTSMADYYEYKGDIEKQYSNLGLAVHSGVDAKFYRKLSDKTSKGDSEPQEAWSTKERNKAQQIRTVLHRKLMIELDKGSVSHALNTVNKLLAVSPTKEIGSIYQRQKESLDNFIASEHVLSTKATVNNNGIWQHQLLRSDFSFTEIQGKLDSVDVRCQNKRHVFSINEQTQWKIPENWKTCHLYVKGKEGTEFSLLELPRSLSNDTKVAAHKN
ncbi:energy transducer TonB [Thalassotalea atypica]|uniref:energy transducer TonB n=1 Tax=Thalassotalea atypica TaxID=2054316 RepID=UPI0025743F0C|nr:energy transducer TonB [Thalassotalea atypica]